MVKEQKMFSIDAIAEELGASLKQIRRYVASGQLAAEQNGSKYLISESSYETFCNQYTRLEFTHFLNTKVHFTPINKG